MSVAVEPVLMRRGDDCLRACAAFVCRVPYEDTPAAVPDAIAHEDWWKLWADWARDQGRKMWFYYDDLPTGRVRWLAAVPSLTLPGREHVVVMRHEVLRYDPAQARSSVDLAEVKYGITIDRATA